MACRSFALFLIGASIFLMTTFVQADQDKVFVIELLNGKLQSPKTMRVKRYDKVALKVISNEVGELHIHAYHIEIPVSTSVTSDYIFVANVSGKFKLEWHPAAQTGEANKLRHKEPLAFLEVYPQ